MFLSEKVANSDNFFFVSFALNCILLITKKPQLYNNISDRG